MPLPYAHGSAGCEDVDGVACCSIPSWKHMLSRSTFQSFCIKEIFLPWQNLVLCLQNVKPGSEKSDLDRETIRMCAVMGLWSLSPWFRTGKGFQGGRLTAS